MSAADAADQLDAHLTEALQMPPSRDFWLLLTEIMRESSEIDRLGADADENYNPRKSSQFLLHHLLKVLHAQPYFQRHEAYLAPLLRLSTAAWELDHGKVHPILAPEPKGTKNAGDLATHAIIKATAARAMGELMISGLSPEQAARKVSSALRQASKRGLKAGNRGPSITWRTVKGWRDGLNQAGNFITSPAAKLAYTQPLGDEFGATSTARGERLIEELRNFAAALV